METVVTEAKPVKMTDAQRRQDAYKKVVELLRPYHARCTAEWHDKQKNAMYLFVVFSKDRDAYWDEQSQSYEQNRVRGVVNVNIMHDGSAHLYYSEDMMQSTLGMERTGKWSDTTAMLERLLPPIPPMQ